MTHPNQSSSLSHSEPAGSVTTGFHTDSVSLASTPSDREARMADNDILNVRAVTAGAERPLRSALRSFLVGNWMMESFTSVDEEGIVTDAMGPGARGVISYAADGWMSVQIMCANRTPYDLPDLDGGTPEQTIAAAQSYFAYAGPFEVDEENAIVYHHLDFSMMPNWQGGVQKRYIKTDGDNGLELSGDPALINGKTQVTRLRWTRRQA